MCCVNGRVPKNSNDDNFGPFNFIQHLRTTDISRNGTVISQTVDIHEDSDVDDVTLSLNGIYSIADLEAICAMVKRIKESGKNINCECCKWGRFTPLKAKKTLLEELKNHNDAWRNVVIEEIDGKI